MVTPPSGLDIPRVERVLREAVAQAQALEWSIASGAFFDHDSQCCCPIGALHIAIRDDDVNGDDADDAIGTFCDETGLAPEDASEFAAWFDGFPLNGDPLRELGARLRREWVPA